MGYRGCRARHWESRRDEFLRDDGDLMSPDEIACKWAKDGAVQRARGALLHYQAAACKAAGDLEAAQPLFEEALAMRRAALPALRNSRERGGGPP